MSDNCPYILKPDPTDKRLFETVRVMDHDGRERDIPIIAEHPLTLFLNGQEIVTMMTICDYPDLLGVGYLVNQNMLKPDDRITAINYDPDIETVVIRTERRTNYEEKMRKKTLTSGCSQGTVFGDVMEKFERVVLPDNVEIRSSWILALLKAINTTPSLYIKAGAIHGCVLCQDDRPLVYIEDVGRHNALDKIAGYMYLHDISGADKVMYTTGRMTSEMVIKTVQMGIPILISRSGATVWAIELAKQTGLTLISRAKGKRFLVLSGKERIVYDWRPPSEKRADRRIA